MKNCLKTKRKNLHYKQFLLSLVRFYPCAPQVYYPFSPECLVCNKRLLSGTKQVNILQVALQNSLFQKKKKGGGGTIK